MTNANGSKLVLNPDEIRNFGNDRKNLEMQIGKKAVGLALLPESWSPSFFVLAASAYPLLASTERAGEIQAANVPGNSLTDAVEPALIALDADNVIVRSSSPTESFYDRGLYLSRTCNSTAAGVIHEAATILAHAATIRSASTPRSTEEQMALVVQKFVHANAAGHLSNERRVSRLTTDWLCEWTTTSKARPKHNAKKFSVREMVYADAKAELACKTPEELSAAWRNVASQSAQLPHRVHFEWIWDGTRLWIVQRDVEEEILASAPSCGWFGRAAPLHASQLAVLRTVDTAQGDWRKLQCIRTFKACSLPCPSVYVLENYELSKSAADHFESRLRDDLGRLLALPIVIRTDVAAHVHRSGFLQPRTETITNLDEAIHFIHETSAAFLARGVESSHFGFIMHRFITAHAGAWSLAKPGIPRVRIDSIWGLPDGLMFYPHDSSDVELSASAIVKMRTRCKSRYLGVDQSGRWSERQCGAPWDWGPSLQKSQLVEVARASQLIAKDLNRPVQTMFFVGVDPGDGNLQCLPWYYTTDEHPEFTVSGRDTSFFRSLIVISTQDDIAKVEKLSKASLLPKGTILCLRPDNKVLRSEDFIAGVGAFAAKNKIVVELEGSALAHAYYTLVRTGATVKCTGAFQPRRARRSYGKLVRDKIPVRIISHGEDARVHHVERGSLIPFLKSKAVEEALEFFWERDPDKSLGELADLLEVIRAVCNVQEVAFERIVALADMKRLERGGFEKGVVLIETKERSLTTRDKDQWPLFADQIQEEPVQEIASDAHSLQNVLGVAQRPHVHQSELMIPLVPRLADHTKPGSVQRLQVPGFDALVRYDREFVRVEIRPSVDPREHEQRMLFD